MAHGRPGGVSGALRGRSNDQESIDVECAVCYQKCVQPVQLECRHIFCFLCVKGAAQALQNRRCPMCRREISPTFLLNPNLLKNAKDDDVPAEEDEGYRWFYEGRNGWWEYDARTTAELEVPYLKSRSTPEEDSGSKSCDLLIAGFLYTIDFENMVQFRKNEPGRRRKIRRDVVRNVENRKGVAGIPKAINHDPPPRQRSDVTDPNDDAVENIDRLSEEVSSLNLLDRQSDQNPENPSPRGLRRDLPFS